MAERLTIPIVRDPDYLPGDRIQFEVAGATINDRVPVWDGSRELMGYGFGQDGQSGYGLGVGLPYGDGLYGRGYYGQGAALKEHQTLSSYVAEDYTVRGRAIDELGNIDGWSSSAIIAHRPDPPAPGSLQLAGGLLSWAWSDP